MKRIYYSVLHFCFGIEKIKLYVNSLIQFPIPMQQFVNAIEFLFNSYSEKSEIDRRPHSSM